MKYYTVIDENGWRDFNKLKKFIIILTVLYDIYHYSNDLVYTFLYPHCNGLISSILLLSILLPLWYYYFMVILNYDEGPDLSPIDLMYINEKTVIGLRFIRTIGNYFIHFIVKLWESLNFGYKWSNYFALMPFISYVSIYRDIGSFVS